jgi:hypothetical protein
MPVDFLTEEQKHRYECYVLEMHVRTGFLSEFTHIHASKSRISDCRRVSVQCCCLKRVILLWYPWSIWHCPKLD